MSKLTSKIKTKLKEIDYLKILFLAGIYTSFIAKNIK